MAKIPDLNECNPGLTPFEYNVLVAPEEIEEKTAGGIYMPPKAQETEELASIRGRLVAVSPAAFNYADWPEGARLPKVGDEVLFAKYAGTVLKGNDGKTYRLIKDRDLAAICG